MSQEIPIHLPSPDAIIVGEDARNERNFDKMFEEVGTVAQLTEQEIATISVSQETEIWHNHPITPQQRLLEAGRIIMVGGNNWMQEPVKHNMPVVRKITKLQRLPYAPVAYERLIESPL